MFWSRLLHLAYSRCHRTFSVGAVAAALAVFSGASAFAVELNKPAPDFDGKTMDGSRLRLSSLKGKVVLLDFWASWCEPCQKELPRLAAMAKKLKAKGIEVVTVNLDTSKEKAEEFLEGKNVQLPIVLDPSGKIAEKYDPPKMPTSFVIDKQGTIRAINEGYEDGDEKKFEAKLLELAAK